MSSSDGRASSTSGAPLPWHCLSLIPPAYHVLPPGAAEMHDRRAKEVRLGEMMRDMRHVFPEPSAEAAEHVEQELRDNRRALGQALHLAASPSTLVTPPGPSPSVLAYAAAAVPLSSAVAPSPLGSALLFPAMRPSSRQQVAYLFQALNAMLEEVGQRKEIARRGAVQVMLTAAASKEGNRKRQVEKELKELIEGHQPEDVQVPNLMADMETYAAWCGLAHVNTAAAESTAATAASSDALSSSSSGHLSSPVAELAIGAFLHTPSKAPAPAASSATPPPSFLRSPAPAPPPKHQRQVSTIDARFESSLEQLVQLADHHNATTTSAQAKSHHSHTSLITVLQEISVYFAGIHEIARQEYQSCQERGDLLHLLVQRCATLTQSLLPLAQREVLHTVASFKSSIHSLMLAQEAAMQEERQRYQKAEIAAAQKMIAQREELKVRRERIETLERECERRKLECAESDRLAHANRELTAQLASLREQVASAEVWRETQRLTMEQLHFSTKDAREKQERAENEARELREQAGREKKKYERNLIHMQTRFLELRIPDAPPPASGTVVADPTGMDPSLHAELSTLLSEHDRLASESLAETLLDARGGMKKHPTGSGGSSSTVESPSRPGLVKLRSRMHGRTDLIYVGQDKGREEEEANGEEKRAVSEGEEEEAAEESDSRSTDDAQANRTTKTTEEESKESTAYPLAPTQAAKPSAASPAKSPHSTAPPSHLRASSLIVGQAPFNTTGGINEGAEEEGEEAEHAMGNDDDEEEDEKNTPEDDAEDADDETASIVTSSTKAFTTSSSSYAALHAALLAPLLKNTRLKYSPAEVTTYLLTRGARFYDMILTKKQKQKFRAIHATTYQSSSSATADPSTATPSTPSHSHSTKKLPTLKLPGQIGPKDWCVNFCWSLLRRKIEADQVADCYQQQRMPFPEWVYQLLLMHETVKGAKSVFLPVMFTSLRSVITYRNVSTVCALIVDLLEESISLDALNFILSLMFVIAQTSVGLDYGPGKYGQIRWLCTLRTRYVNRLAFSEFPPSALQEFNAAIDSHSQAMSLAEIKQHNQTVLLLKERERENKRNGNLQKDGGNHPLEFMNDRDIKQLTKIDYGMYLRLAAKHYKKLWKTQVTNVKTHFEQALARQERKAMTLAGFTTFVRKLSPNLDARHIQQMFIDATQHHSKGDGVRYVDFKAAGGLQLLVKDFPRLIYHHSDFGMVTGVSSLLSCVETNWLRLRPIIQPLLELAATDRSQLSTVLSERLQHMSENIDALRLSLLHNHTNNSRRVRELVKAFREIVYEIYGYLRYREEYGAIVKVKNRYDNAAELSVPLSPEQQPTILYAPAPGPNAAALNDEIHSLLFMIQRELLAFCPAVELPLSDRIHLQDQPSATE